MLATTQCLLDWQARPHDPGVAERLARAVYGQLREIAAARLRREQAQPFTPTELVHETWLRLKPPGEALSGREQFYKLASTAMRNLLVDQARERLADKRGGGQVRITLSLADREHGFSDERLLDLDRALARLAVDHPRPAQVVTLRSFGGLELTEVAQALAVSLATIKRDWAFACAWLADALRPDGRENGNALVRGRGDGSAGGSS